jgi:hemerythrin-like domain-containing protein
MEDLDNSKFGLQFAFSYIEKTLLERMSTMLIYEILKKDHDTVKTLLSELISLSQDNMEEKHRIIDEIRDELIPHSRAEEEVFYNALRSLDAGKGKIMHSYKEHLEAETLLRTLQLMDKIDADWKDTTEKLRDALEHHIEEEETTIFDIAKQTFSDQEAEKIGEAFEALKPKVQQEGFMKNTLDLVVNLLPPRLSSKLGRQDNVSKH